MRMSCNGCRVLRKGCSDDCTLKPCLQWIKSPDSQANATLFLAKFYGRAGLLNLINAGPSHLHPEIFRSLLYEACGRIINPVHGAVGLMCSGEWPRCQAAVDAVLGGAALETEPGGGGGDIRRRTGPRKRGLIRVDQAELPPEERFTITGWAGDRELKREPSHDSVSVETVEPSLVNRDFKPESRAGEIGLELSLGRNPAVQAYLSTAIEISDSDQ